MKKKPSKKRNLPASEPPKLLMCALCRQRCKEEDHCAGCDSFVCQHCDKVCIECSPLFKGKHAPEYHRDYECSEDCAIGGEHLEMEDS